MNLLSLTSLSEYWSASVVETNILVFFNLIGALLLGLVVGYERAYHGRAAGMRTYGLVCMASAALTAILGYPEFWYGGHATHSALAAAIIPTQVIQGIVTGIGFLGAGVIMKEGFNISGLTTAASIWASSAIGILVGIGFYATAILLTLLSALSMSAISRLEEWLPSRTSAVITLLFRPDFAPRQERLSELMSEMGYDVAWNSLVINSRNGSPEWQFIAVSRDKHDSSCLSDVAQILASFEGVENYQLSLARN
ncbi:MAG: MgtC/SapB family protein [Sulfuriferula sp.]|nr:MgtC/SapB family protein [Sulfuriferula sp.]